MYNVTVIIPDSTWLTVGDFFMRLELLHSYVILILGPVSWVFLIPEVIAYGIFYGTFYGTLWGIPGIP